MTSFDLVVATVDRVDALERLLTSLDQQTYRGFRVLIVDQNEDERLTPVIARHPSLQIERHRSSRGLSTARNAALPLVGGDVVAFPDDDCIYPHDLLERVTARFEREPSLDGLSGRDDRGTWPQGAVALTRTNLWNRAISFGIFLRVPVVRRVGSFDVRLGIPHSSGEEIDYLIRAVDAGARIEYDPNVVVHHDATDRPLPALGARDGRSIGYLLRKHRYPAATVAQMLIRPFGGGLVAAAHRDGTRLRFHAETLRGRISGYRAAAP